MNFSNVKRVRRCFGFISSQLSSCQLCRSDPNSSEEIASVASKSDVLLSVTSDTDFAKRVAKELESGGAKVSLETVKHQLDVGDLMIDTEPAEGVGMMAIKLHIKAKPLQVVKDQEGPGERFIVEMAD